jgi:hypothetical protein
MKIRIFSNFCESKHAINVIERIYESKLISSYGKDLSFTNTDDYTHVIIYNTAMPKIDIPKERVIGLAFEPITFLGLNDTFIEYAKQYIGKYFIGDTFHLPKPFLEYYSYMWHCTPLNYIPIKHNKMSIMISVKNYAPGHIYRHDLVTSILKTNLPIDIYGNGCVLYEKYQDTRVKGKFEELEPYETYQFHIAIENYQSNHYFSEKIVNPLLCSTIPIYLGCKNIDHYFPGNILTLSGDMEEDMNLLEDILLNSSIYMKKIDVSLIKKKTNLLLNLNDLFMEV